MSQSHDLTALRSIAAQAKPQQRTAILDVQPTLPAIVRLLTPKRFHQHLGALRAFCEVSKRIIDSKGLEVESKLAHIDSLERTLCHGTIREAHHRPAQRLRAAQQSDGTPDRYARHMLRARRRDCVKARFGTWNDFLLYGRFLASPMGREILDVYGESPEAGPSMDALCISALALSRLITCRQDWVEHGRCYIPLDWFDAANISCERLVETRSDKQVRRIFDRYLDGIDRLLGRAESLPTQIHSRSLRRQVRIAISIARTVRDHLRRTDPLGSDAMPSRVRLAAAAMRGLLADIAGR